MHMPQYLHTKQIIFEFFLNLQSAYSYMMVIFLSLILKSITIKFHLGNLIEFLRFICISDQCRKETIETYDCNEAKKETMAAELSRCTQLLLGIF